MDILIDIESINKDKEHRDKFIMLCDRMVKELKEKAQMQNK